MSRFAEAWRRRPWLTLGFALALGVTLMLAVRLTVSTVYWSDPTHREQALEGWMTPGYVAHSWDVDRDMLRDALGPGAQPGARVTLEQIAARNGEPLETLITRLEAVLAAGRAGG